MVDCQGFLSRFSRISQSTKTLYLFPRRSLSPPRLNLFAAMLREKKEKSTAEIAENTEKTRGRIIKIGLVKISVLFFFRAFPLFRGPKNSYSSLCLSQPFIPSVIKPLRSAPSEPSAVKPLCCDATRKKRKIYRRGHREHGED